MFSGVRKCGKAEPAQPIQEKTERLKELLWQADAVLVGRGLHLQRGTLPDVFFGF